MTKNRSPELLSTSRITTSTARQFREQVFSKLSPPSPTPKEATPSPTTEAHKELIEVVAVSDARNWTKEQILTRLEEVKLLLAWPTCEGNARKWWLAFEDANKTRPSLVLRLAEELALLKATITEFFSAYVYSNTDNIQANVDFLRYQRLKKKWNNREVPLYSVSEATQTGLTKSHVRRLLEFEHAYKPAQLYWECVEFDCTSEVDGLAQTALSLCAKKDLTLDKFYQLAVFSGSPYPKAALTYSEFLQNRSEELKTKGSLPSEAKALWDLTPNVEDGHALSSKLRLLQIVTEGVFLDKLQQLFPTVFSTYSNEPAITQRLLRSQFTDTPLMKRRRSPFEESSSDLNLELASWSSAINAFPGANQPLPFAELIVSQVIPSLDSNLDRLSDKEIRELEEKITSMVMHEVSSLDTISLLMLYSHERHSVYWEDMVRALEASFPGVRDAWLDICAGRRAPARWLTGFP